LSNSVLLLLLLLQGSSVIYAMLATLPEMNDKVSVVVHLGECMLTISNTCRSAAQWYKDAS
jgi:hypothetical protein